jgi:multidrug efflux system outer membrane protein
VSAVLLLTLAGCVNLPQTRQADLPLPAAWPSSPPPQGGEGPGERGNAIAADWWKAFHDPVLDVLMDEALAHNADLKLAAARILEARAALGATRADQFPGAQLAASVGRTRATEEGSFPIPTPINNNYQLQLQAAYELDLWGRYARASDAARADLLASQYGREVARLSLTHDVAAVWFGLAALSAQTELARDTLANREEALVLQRLRVSGGVSSDYELQQAEAELAATRGDLARLEQARRQAEHALALLLGRSPKALVEERVAPGKSLADLALPPAVPAGLPSELLQRRPDLKQAEANLAAAQARIAEARAAIYPDLSLTAYLGSESRALSDLFSGPATIWGLTAGLVQTVFNAGRTEAVVQGRAARQEQLLLGYEQAVRQAFREVLDALVAQRQAAEIDAAETRRAEALARAAELADLRYRNGVASYLEVLDARRNQYQARQAVIDARRARLAAVAGLSKALGGGWEGRLAEVPVAAKTSSP